MLLLAMPALSVRPPHDLSSDPRDLGRCKLKAVHARDNDIRPDQSRRATGDQPVDLPEPVAHQILNHVSKIVRKSYSRRDWMDAKLSCSDIFSPVFELDGPGGLQLYVAPRYFPSGNSVDYFLTYDPKSGAITKLLPLIYTKWWDPAHAENPLMKRPFVRIERARDGWPSLLIVEEQTHNGNVYNAGVYRYFEIGSDMSLTQVLAVEARATIVDEAGYTSRKVTFLSPNRARIDVSSPSSSKWAAKGSALLTRTGIGKPFHVARRTSARGHKPDYLVTYCDSAKSDDDFLKVGCDFYY